MNTLHLKYAVEVEKTGSISKAAENLFMNQPHLSKTIKELEDSLGVVIFKRSTKGVVPTRRGREFLNYAKKILAQVEEIESLYKPEDASTVCFDVAVPRASYISFAFTEFLRTLEEVRDFRVNYRETNALSVIKDVFEMENSLGIVRYQLADEYYYMDMLRERELAFEPILEFEYLALMSEGHPLAAKRNADIGDFMRYTEIVHGDRFFPTLPRGESRAEAQAGEDRREIALYERGSQMEILARVPGTYMWVSPMPPEVLSRFSLVQKRCPSADNRHKDILIYRNGYSLSAEALAFIDKLRETAAYVSKCTER